MSWSFAKNTDMPSEILTGTWQATITTRSASEKPFRDNSTVSHGLHQRMLHCRAQDCGWISSQRATIARHCRTHGWRSTPDDREYWTDVWVQSFSLTPGKQRWFPVYVDEGPLPPDERRSSEIQAILDEVKLEYAVYQANKEREEDERNARMYPMLNTPLTDLEITLMYQSCWLERTGWVLHLWESNLAHLAHAARLPGKDEPELEVIAAAIEDLIEDCVKGLASLPLDIRRWLRSDHPTIMHPRPMGRLTNRIVHYKYANTWKRLICYSLRVAQSEESHEAESPSPFVKKEENEAGIPIMRGDRMDDVRQPSPRRAEQKDEVKSEHSYKAESPHPLSLVKMEDDDAKPPIVHADKMSDARRLFPWRDGQKEQAKKLLQSAASGNDSIRSALLNYSQTFIFQSVYYELFDSPMLHAMAILGIYGEEARLKEGHECSFMVAGLLYCSRVIASEMLLPSQDREQQGDAEYEVFLQKRKATIPDGSMSVFSNMINLLFFARLDE
ncbi:hypothetical protein E4U32_000014 [Claviceps aff. humidiphila group G2b]|nr:hypothetical protein E4U32_000014 [Claviceps aff. humidiphila group G2b]